MANAHGLEQLSAERVRDEWMRGLEGAQEAGRLVDLWRDVGALERWLPEVGSGQWAVGSGQMRAVDGISPRDPVLITSYLSNDPAATLARIKCSNAEIERGKAIGEHRGTEPDAASAVEVRWWMSKVGAAANDLVAIAVAEERGDELTAAVQEVRDSGAPLTVGNLAVDGNDLMDAGIEQGPSLGKMLARLLDDVLTDPSLNTQEGLLERVRAP